MESLTEPNSMIACAWECTRQSRWKEQTQRYLANLLLNSVHLRDELLGGTYRVKPTKDFYLNERGHIRFIEAPDITDRCVQKPLMKQVLLPRLRKHLIYDNYASLEDRGTSFARKRFEIHLRRYIRKHGTDGYILLMDYSKYFETVVHETLKRMLAPHLTEEPQDVVNLIHYMIDTASHTDKGLNLGSECPQIFAVFYPTPIDNFFKVVKGEKYYGRYMDDGFDINESAEHLHGLIDEISPQLAVIGLRLNEKKTHVVKLSHGFTWLQTHYTITRSGHIIKRPTSSKMVRERRRLKAFKRLYDRGLMTEQEVWQCYQSWRGTIVREYNAYRKSLAGMDALYRSLFPDHKQQPKPLRSATVKGINRSATKEDMYYCLTA